MKYSKKADINPKRSWHELKEDEKEIVLCLIHLPAPVSINTLISLCKSSPVEILNFMESLKEKKLVHEKSETGKGHYFQNDLDLLEFFQIHLSEEERPDLLKRIIDFYLHSAEQGEEATLTLAGLYMKAGIAGEGLSVIKRAADIFYGSGRREKAIVYYNYLVQQFAARMPSQEEAADYLDSIDRIFSIIPFLFMRPHLYKDLLERAHMVSRKYQHPYYQAKTALFLVLQSQTRGDYREADGYINEFKKLAKKINDEDLTRTGILLMTTFMNVKGDLSKAIDYYERMTGGLEKFGDTGADILAGLMVATHHISCGRIARGMGMIEAIRSKTESLHLNELVGMTDLAMAIALIEIRDITNARLYVERLRKSSTGSPLDQIMMEFYHKCMGCILCVEEDYENAFKHLKMAYRQLGPADATVQVYTFWPWILECLYLVESKGFVDDKINLDSEINNLVSSNNPHLKGAALRYRALKNMARRQSQKTVLSDLKQSERHLDQVGAKLELARTRIALGNYHLSRGRTKDGKSYLEKAWLLLLGIDRDLIPKDLLDIMPWDQKVGIIIDRVTEINRSFGKAKDISSFLERVINAAIDFTMATRGAFLALEAGELKMVAGRNLFSTFFDAPEAGPVKEIITDTIKKDKELIMPRGDSNDKYFQNMGFTSFIGMPVRLADNIYGCLILDGQIKDTFFSEHSIPFVRMLASQVALGLSSLSTYEKVKDLKERFEDEATFYKRQMGLDTLPEMIIGRSEGIRKIINQIQQVASTDSAVLILGETGVGKELVAKAIHNLSPRKDGPFIPVNLAALPQELVMSELFGHEKGAFTGASEKQKGRFELAEEGTIFLDEIGELPPNIQVKLLRVLQEGTFERLGNAKAIRANFRVIAATNKNLLMEIEKGTFRQDLYYRLNVFPIAIPPLRERKADIQLLLLHFLEFYSKKFSKNIEQIPTDEIKKLQSYHWPGNVRELQHMVERSVILSEKRAIRFSDIETSSARSIVDENQFIAPLIDMEKNHIERALKATGWRVSGPEGAARILGLKRSTLINRMKKLGIQRPKFSDPECTDTD